MFELECGKLHLSKLFYFFKLTSQVSCNVYAANHILKLLFAAKKLLKLTLVSIFLDNQKLNL